MSVEIIGLLGLIAMFILMFLRVPLAIAMVIPAFIGIIYLRDWNTLKSAIETIVWDHSFSYTLSTIPMFVLMGELLFISGIGTELFSTFRAWLGKLRGGLGISTIGSSALFAAASGSSLANTATMGLISSKEMIKNGYNQSLASGSIIAGGTLGILIPPSTTFIIYGMMTEQSIGQLLIAGIIPGITLMLIYMLTVYLLVLFKPSLAPTVKVKISWKERFATLKNTIWIILIFIIVIGGMYLGFFSPTEAAGIGAFSTFIITLLRRKLTFKKVIEAMTSTLQTTGFLFAIIIMAFILNYFFTITKVPFVLADFINGLSLSPAGIFAVIIIMYIILGAVMDAMAMMVVTIPIVLPVIQMLELDLIWFGVIIVLVIEMALITPPVGLINFVLKKVSPELELINIFKGSLIFTIPILIMIIILYLFPELALYLPNKMY